MVRAIQLEKKRLQKIYAAPLGYDANFHSHTGEQTNYKVPAFSTQHLFYPMLIKDTQRPYRLHIFAF